MAAEKKQPATSISLKATIDRDPFDATTDSSALLVAEMGGDCSIPNTIAQTGPQMSLAAFALTGFAWWAKSDAQGGDSPRQLSGGPSKNHFKVVFNHWPRDCTGKGKSSEVFRMRPSADVIERNRYAVILAGGDATRLMPLSRRITGRPVPKQFCPVIGGSTLLDQTRGRVALSFSPKRTLVVLTRRHHDFYADRARSLPASRLVIQPENRGVAAAILYAILRIAKRDRYATVTIFPSDHYVDSEWLFMSYVDLATRVAGRRCTQLILLGIKPDRAESAHGWIEPAARLPDSSRVFRVKRFWEKPPKAVAQELWRQGCLWNTFIVAGTPRSFLTMIGRAAPAMKRAFSSIWPALDTCREREAIEKIYATLADCDFSRDVLAPNARSLAVVPVENVYWNDLGDPKRVYEALARTGVRPCWITQRASRNKTDFVRRPLPRAASVRNSTNGRPRGPTKSRRRP